LSKSCGGVKVQGRRLSQKTGYTRQICQSMKNLIVEVIITGNYILEWKILTNAPELRLQATPEN